MNRKNVLVVLLEICRCPDRKKKLIMARIWTCRQAHIIRNTISRQTFNGLVVRNFFTMMNKRSKKLNRDKGFRKAIVITEGEISQALVSGLIDIALRNGWSHTGPRNASTK